MTLVNDITKYAKRSFGSTRAIKDEDALRRLAVNERRGYRLPIIYNNNEFLLTRQAAWTGFEVRSKPWGFLDKTQREGYFRAADSVFSRIFPADKESGGHLLVTNRTHTAEEWRDNLIERSSDTATVNFRRYVDESRKVIDQREFFEREVYLFSRLGARGAKTGIMGALQGAVDFIAKGAGMDDAQPDVDEQEFWSVQSESMLETLGSSWLGADPINRRRVEWLIRHLDTPGLPTPDYAPADLDQWGAGEWRTVLAAYTSEVDLGTVQKHRIRAVKFDAPTGEGVSYAAYLPIAHIPDNLHFQQNWLHHAASLPFPVDVSMHFEVVDPDRAEKDLQRPITDAEAQEEEDQEAGVRTDDATQIQQQGLRKVKVDVQMGRQPLAYWQAVLCVYDTDPAELRGKVARLIKHYRDIHFELVCPNHDQRELFYQSFPGSEILVEDWMHRTSTKYLAAAQPWLTSSVGDRDQDAGLYQGHTIVRDSNGHQQKGVPVFYDLQNVVDLEGKAPTEVVCGDPGSGKSVSRGLKVAHEDALRGITQFVWDPKGDFLPLVTYARQMQLDPKKVKHVDLHDPDASVSLDPFSIAEVDKKKNIDDRDTAAREVLHKLCDEYLSSNDSLGLLYRRVLNAAVQTVLRIEREGGETASMEGVLSTMRLWAEGGQAANISDSQMQMWRDCSASLVEHLESIRRETLGRLLFRDGSEGRSIKVTEGDLVIFVAINMQVTEAGQKPTAKTIVPDVISGLMTDFIRSLLFTLPDEVPKSLIFDEWHVIKRTNRAEALVDWLRRMGRSKRCMVRQMSQSAADFKREALSTVWCGYAENEESARASCKLLGIEASQASISLLMSMGKGQFLFRDVHGRVAQVQVDIWDDWLLDRFNTQANAKALLRAKEEAAAASQS